MSKKGQAGIVFVIILLLLLVMVACNSQWSINTGEGQHNGQVTAVEDTGLIWRTTTVYVKSDISSSQEDSYCLDKSLPNYGELRSRLEAYSLNRTKVTIYFYDYFIRGIAHCNTGSDEVAMIKDVKGDE